ncbi:MAG: hypothetical protein IPM20_08995 [Gammaproteobacteria bacterium]|nr:hypothetical protein [Gammaproteobacteria bacterium]
MNAEAGLFGSDSVSWKEEVLLHDGSKIIVTRSQTRGGSHEIGQPPPVKEHTISFVLPGTSKPITWISEYSKDIGRSNFDLLAVHILNGAPYIVASPNLCLSYNKWGRPNPPYILFKYDGKDWKRISLSEFPIEFKTINVAADTLGDESKLVTLGFVSAEKIEELNSEFKQPEYRSIVREPVKGAGITKCEQMIPYGKGGWLGLDWFKDQPTYEACMKFCERKGVRKEDCPCETLFKGEK